MRPVAVITGASSGIGMVFAQRLAASHDLLLVARRRDRLEALAAELAATTGSAVDILTADLTNEDDLTIVADRIAALPNLGLVVNNAGFGTRGMFWEVSLKDHEEMHRVHVMATLRLTYAALPVMLRQNSGGIINVASAAVFIRQAGRTSYSATKTWMTIFTEGLSLELKSIQSAVKVQALCPGFTHTEFHDAIRLNQADRAERESRTPPSLWLKAEDIVDDSLKGLSQGKLFVVPGWRYKVFAALISKLPTSTRLALEARVSRTGKQGTVMTKQTHRTNP
jgi:uncharacterized protein